MREFKGFDDWIEIFRGGKQVDSQGREHNGDAVIARVIEGFNPAIHEPPAVIGHPKSDDPAYAWVEGVKEAVQDGAKVLLAKFKQVVPEFEDMVERGLFKKRSIGIYPDGRLKHVAFLGAAPPAVKGLAAMGFSGGEESFEFSFNDTDSIVDEQTQAGLRMAFYVNRRYAQLK